MDGNIYVVLENKDGLGNWVWHAVFKNTPPHTALDWYRRKHGHQLAKVEKIRKHIYLKDGYENVARARQIELTVVDN